MLHEDRVVQTHLSAFIDCHSRYIVEARYYLRENLDILIDSLLRAWSIHGASRELYLDNAKIYHAHALRRACCALNIRLLHRGVGDPPPGGLIERFFRTAQTQLEAEVRAGAAADAASVEPVPDGLAGGQLPRSVPTAKPDSRRGSAMSKVARSPATWTCSRSSGTSCTANAAR